MTIVRCQALSKRYGATIALDSVSLALSAGAPIALVGPNGAGKTTLMAAIAGYLTPSSGSLSVFAEFPGSPRLHGRVSALPQDAQFDPHFSLTRQLTVFANLQSLHGQRSTTEVARVLSLVQLSDVGHYRPGQLSHGMRKRAAIAQALLGKPELILLDEPTAGLDPENARAIRDLIHDIADSATFLISSHNLDELQTLCDRVIHLHQGQLARYAAIKDDSDERFLTVRLLTGDISNVQATLLQLPGVRHVHVRAHGDYVLEYDAVCNPQLDQDLIQLLAKKCWPYRHLVRGRSLEETLFVRD